MSNRDQENMVASTSQQLQQAQSDGPVSQQPELDDRVFQQQSTSRDLHDAKTKMIIHLTPATIATTDSSHYYKEYGQMNQRVTSPGIESVTSNKPASNMSAYDVNAADSLVAMSEAPPKQTPVTTYFARIFAAIVCKEYYNEDDGYHRPESEKNTTGCCGWKSKRRARGFMWEFYSDDIRPGTTHHTGWVRFEKKNQLKLNELCYTIPPPGNSAKYCRLLDKNISNGTEILHVTLNSRLEDGYGAFVVSEPEAKHYLIRSQPNLSLYQRMKLRHKYTKDIRKKQKENQKQQKLQKFFNTNIRRGTPKEAVILS